ncbi:hypothetical protein Tco_1002088 [Tanacetum coccineum]|uniref:Uncharacterized protein n=1 Tax=Tanacetum coccineum TaxID=301880 RepID=A0ABQ5F5K1_9ASTR
MNALWKLWNKNNDQEGRIFRRIDEEVNNNREPWNDQIEVSENESEVAEIFRIETADYRYTERSHSEMGRPVQEQEKNGLSRLSLYAYKETPGAA